jgi:hypothetical protein
LIEGRRLTMEHASFIGDIPDSGILDPEEKGRNRGKSRKLTG